MRVFFKCVFYGKLDPKSSVMNWLQQHMLSEGNQSLLLNEKPKRRPLSFTVRPMLTQAFPFR